LLVSSIIFGLLSPGASATVNRNRLSAIDPVPRTHYVFNTSSTPGQHAKRYTIVGLVGSLAREAQ
jgi:hypothetical protein